MTSDKAIEVLKNGGTQEEFVAATKLGIEALERCRSNYLNPQQADFRRLPSETEE